jgi:hypothetical protein
MDSKTMERWAWVLIFGGGLVGSLGLFMVRLDGQAGWALLGLAAAALVGGVVLIVLRSRRPPGG